MEVILCDTTIGTENKASLNLHTPQHLTQIFLSILQNTFIFVANF